MDSEESAGKSKSLISIISDLKTSDRISVVAAAIAFASMLAAIVQNIGAERIAEQQQHIQSAVAISKDYLKNRYDVFSNYTSAASENAIRTLEYISYLSNNDLIDRRYLSFQLKCDIRKVCEQESKIPESIKPIPCIENFAQIASGCPGQNPALCQPSSNCRRQP